MTNNLLLSAHLATVSCYLGYIHYVFGLTIMFVCVCDPVLQYPFLLGQLLCVFFPLECLCFGSIF